MYYLIGIKGTGMSALALALKSLNYDVIGSDKEESFFTEKELIKKNIKILNFKKENIDEYKNSIFIIGHAYNSENNEEVKRLSELGLTSFYYSKFINSFFKNKKIGVSGSHGKTTVSKILATYLPYSSYIIGDGSGVANESDKYLIVEACEYKKNFLNYDFDILIINNIDYDHPDFYKSLDEYYQAFVEASNQTKVLICNGDDDKCKQIKHIRKYTFGFNRGNNCLIKVLEKSEKGYKASFKIGRKTYIYDIPFFGIHMLYNIASVILLMHLEKIKIELDFNKLKLPRIRMEERKYKSNILIDDYAHHPTEIKNVIDAVKQKYPNYEIITIFQPHTYSRTLELKKEFRDAFKEIKEAYLLKTFTSREKFDKAKEREVKRVFHKCKYITKDDYIKLNNYENKVILILGAGDIHNLNLKSFS